MMKAKLSLKFGHPTGVMHARLAGGDVVEVTAEAVEVDAAEITDEIRRLDRWFLVEEVQEPVMDGMDGMDSMDGMDKTSPSPSASPSAGAGGESDVSARVLDIADNPGNTAEAEDEEASPSPSPSASASPKKKKAVAPKKTMVLKGAKKTMGRK